jgi:putative PIN family toxin of toxin-antitoxin system
MKLVLDTNVVMELLHYRDPRSVALMQAIASGEHPCFTDATCLSELCRVLGYVQFKLDDAAQQDLMNRYKALATEFPEAPIDLVLPRCRDKDDQKFMELAARCGADLLVTRDRELLKLARRRARPAPFGIVEPERAIKALGAHQNTPPETSA